MEFAIHKVIIKIILKQIKVKVKMPFLDFFSVTNYEVFLIFDVLLLLQCSLQLKVQ